MSHLRSCGIGLVPMATGSVLPKARVGRKKGQVSRRPEIGLMPPKGSMVVNFISFVQSLIFK